MEPRFEVQTVYSKEYVYKLYHTFSIRPKYLRTRYINLGVAFLYVFIMLPQINPMIVQPLFDGTFIKQLISNPVGTLFVLASPAITVYFLIRSVFAARLDAIRGWREKKKYEGTITSTSFFDDHLCDVSNQNFTTTLAYSEVTAVEESNDFFFILYPGGRAVISAKSDFTIGTPDDFCAFIQEKTGKKIKHIH